MRVCDEAVMHKSEKAETARIILHHASSLVIAKEA